MRRFFPLLLAFSLTACRTSETPSIATTSASASATPTPPSTVAGLTFVEMTTGGATEKETLPLIVIAHGLGDRPESMLSLYGQLPARARLVALRAPRAYHGGFSWFPSRFEGATDAEMVDGIRTAATQITQAMKELARAYPTSGKPIMTGFSQGGMLSFEIAVHHPEAISAAFPLSGWLSREMWPSTKINDAAYPRIQAFHGEEDPMLTVDRTRAVVEQLSSLGYPIELRTYPGLEHRTNETERHDIGVAISAAVERAKSAGPLLAP